VGDTPRTDEAAFVAQTGIRKHDVVTIAFSETLERELNAANAELAKLKKVIRKIYYKTETYADGAPDATAHDKLCNDISCELERYIKA